MRFHDLHRPGHPLILPNAWDYASGAALVAAGFRAIGTTSLGVAAAHGLPDAQGVARDQTVALARMLSRLDCMYTVDIEAGFSADPAEVAALVVELAGIGAVGVNLEDGRPTGTLAPVDVQCSLLAAVKAAAPQVFLNARTDTHWLGGYAVDEAIARCRSYVEAGADGVFIPGLTAAEDIREVVRAVGVPVNVLGNRAVAGLGVARISTGSLLFRAALGAAVAVARGEEPSPGIPTYAEVQRY
jgi:2-methylisocitrate lyase-like PEP mutase family enzyme